MKSRTHSPAVPAAAKPKVPKGFIMVNLSGWEEKEMRALCRECGITFRLALENAVRYTNDRLREEARIVRETGLRLNERQSLVKTCAPEKN